MGGDGYEPDGWEPPCGWDLPGPEYEYEPDEADLAYLAELEYEPDDIDLAHMRFLSLLPGDVEPEFGHFTDREIDSFSRTFDADADELFELFRAVLFLRGWRLARRVPWPTGITSTGKLGPALALLLWLLRVLPDEAGQDAARPLGADRRPAADLTPPVALLRARSVLTCAPPARVSCPAGATG